MSDPLDPTRSTAMPVTVPHQDRILMRHPNAFVAVAGMRAYPQAVMFQLLVKARFTDSWQPNFAFGLKHLHNPGDIEIGAEIRGPEGEWQPAPANFAGGGGGGDGEPGTIGHYEFKWWVPFTPQDQGLRLWCSWQQLDVPRSEAEFDMDEILKASRASQPAWLT